MSKRLPLLRGRVLTLLDDSAPDALSDVALLAGLQKIYRHPPLTQSELWKEIAYLEGDGFVASSSLEEMRLLTITRDGRNLVTGHTTAVGIEF